MVFVLLVLSLFSRAGGPPFVGEAVPIPPEIRQEMIGVSWHEGCPVGLDDLRLLRLSHWTLDGRVATGELVVAATEADAVLQVFRAIFEAGFPVERMERIDAYGGSDDASMAADNTSAFNCRPVAGGTRWSEHAFGAAVDLNPLRNPYVRGDRVDPPAGRDWLDRGDVRPGMIVEGDAVVQAFAAVGWRWGGRWKSAKDYQHFSRSGR